MKKLFFVFGLFLIPSFCSASVSDINNRIWRSSFTEATELDAFIASGTIVCFVDVLSAGQNSSLEIYDGSVSTVTATKKQDIDTTNNSQDHWYAVQHSSGLIYKNKGDTPAKIRILWDWLYAPMKGHENKGN